MKHVSFKVQVEVTPRQPKMWFHYVLDLPGTACRTLPPACGPVEACQAVPGPPKAASREESGNGLPSMRYQVLTALLHGCKETLCARRRKANDLWGPVQCRTPE